MILGLGSDIVEIERIEDLLDRQGERFLERIFTPREQQKAQQSSRPAASFAKRFAAKEACSKALGTGLSKGLSWKEMEVTNLSSGQPQLTLSHKAEEQLKQLVTEGFKPKIHISLSDTEHYAEAVVIISAVPE